MNDPSVAQVPEPVDHPGLLLIGDYLFDSTLNGVLDSARVAVQLLENRLRGTDPFEFDNSAIAAHFFE